MLFRSIYGLDLAELDDPNQSLGLFLAGRLGDNLVVGDQYSWQGMIWTVAEMDGDEARKIGVRFLDEDPV